GPPFVDQDGDGLADIDSVGHYVDANGAVIAAPPPFPEAGQTDTATRDSLGRALAADGKTPLYKYLDLDGTVIGGMSREALTLMDPTKETTLGLVYGDSGVLGPDGRQTWVVSDSLGLHVASI